VLVKRPDFIILDEATSNMDFITEQQIYDTIFNKMKDTTMLIIAHRLSTIRKCDSIHVMDEGKIIESGTHDELINKNGFYYKLWESQVGETSSVKHERNKDCRTDNNAEKNVAAKDSEIKEDTDNGDEIEYG